MRYYVDCIINFELILINHLSLNSEGSEKVKKQKVCCCILIKVPRKLAQRIAFFFITSQNKIIHAMQRIYARLLATRCLR